MTRRARRPAGDRRSRRRAGRATVSRSRPSSCTRRDTEIKVYDGEVEQFVVRRDAGRRHPRRPRPSASGSRTPARSTTTSLAETLAEARDNARFGTPDEFVGLATPDGVAVADARPVARRAGRRARPTARSSSRSRSSGSRRAPTRGSRRRSRRLRRLAQRSRGRHHHRHPRRGPRDGLLRLGVGDRRRKATRRRPASASRSAAIPTTSTSTSRANDAAERATRMLGATKPASERLTVVLDPYVTAQFLGIIGSTLYGEAVLKGRSLFADRVGDQIADAAITFVDDPTNAAAFTPPDRRRGSRDAAQQLDRRRGPAGLPAQRVHRATARRGVDGVGGAGGFKSTPRRGARACRSRPVIARRTTSSPPSTTASSCSPCRPALRRQPGLR